MVAPLPIPTDIPAGPRGISAPGGRSLPEMAGETTPDAPQISEITEITFPDETLAMTGWNLEGAHLRVWAEGRQDSLQPLETGPDRTLAVVPKDFPKSTLLVWPERDGQVGRPIRVNAATAWWTWPGLVRAGEARTIKIMGKNLSLEAETQGIESKVYLEGPKDGCFLEIETAEPYHLEAELPEHLEPGAWRVWVHNGTGGDYGWSDPLILQVEAGVIRSELPEFPVADFGARPGTGENAAPAIQKAIAAAEKTGGMVLFEAGQYLIASPLEIRGENVHLKGAGAGEYAPDKDCLSGTFTFLRYLDEKNLPSHLIAIHSPYASVRHMTLQNDNNGDDQVVIGVYAPHARVENVRLLSYDKRNWGLERLGPPRNEKEKNKRDRTNVTRAVIDSGALCVNTKGDAHTIFQNSEVHAVGPGILAGKYIGGAPNMSTPEDFRLEPSSDGILVRNVVFRGHYPGEPSALPNPGGSGRAVGVILYNAKKVVVENCDFASYDRYHAKIMTRTALIFNTSQRYLYFAHNHSVDVGSHHSAEGMDINQAEQYLFHLRYKDGGLFHVLDADDQHLTIDTSEIKPNPTGKAFTIDSWNSEGSRLHDEVGENRHWFAYIGGGKGVGQVREIADKKVNGTRVRLALRKPWRVTPDASSRVYVIPIYTNIIVYKNFGDTGELNYGAKSHGITFWFFCFNNVIANNTFRNMTAGIVWNSRFSGPTGWNVTRENHVERVEGYVGDTSQKAALYVDHFRICARWPLPEDHLWYEVGNVIRANSGKDGEVGAYLHTRFTDRVWGGLPPEEHSDGGLMLCVVENNHFENVQEGIVYSIPARSCVFRNNHVETVYPDMPTYEDQNNGLTREVHIIED